jgi:hypothetical protein
MKIIGGIIVALLLVLGTWVPSEARTPDPQSRRWQRDRNVRLWEGRREYRRPRYRARYPRRYSYRYRNYGQYRRTQVGNRRYRMVRRSYWDDGRRYYRWVRIYY